MPNSILLNKYRKLIMEAIAYETPITLVEEIQVEKQIWGHLISFQNDILNGMVDRPKSFKYCSNCGQDLKKV